MTESGKDTNSLPPNHHLHPERHRADAIPMTESGKQLSEDEDVCGFCNLPGADKVPHPERWPGEQSAGTPYVHASCEEAECARAHMALSEKQRENFLRTI